ncbi:MAG: hypothetical protein HY680_04110 [Chloroflexi bacterium]|nr:hypothetical protein [Chloroflexota bacterium]
MNWKLLLAFSSFGLALGVASLFGLPRLIEWPLRLALGLFCAYWLARKLPARQVIHAFLIGFIAGVFTSLVQTTFFSTYAAHNPHLAVSFEKLPPGMDPRQYLLSYAPVIGLFQGVAMAVFTWTASNLVKGPALAREAQQPEAPHPTNGARARPRVARRKRR